jgi:hypothetical protein
MKPQMPPSSRSFGIVFGCVSLLIAARANIDRGALFQTSLLVSSTFLFTCAVLMPSVLDWPSRQWDRLGRALGRITHPMIMGILYFGVVTPFGLVARIVGKDPLKQCLEKSTQSYWIKRELKTDPQNMKLQF